MTDNLETLEAERDNLRRELRAVQEMLAQVLFSIGAQVRVDKDNMGKLADGTQIMIDDDLESGEFVFYLKAPQ